MMIRKRLLTAVAFWTMATAMATAGLNLQVTVHCEEPGTLFVKIMEQIEEVGELTDISELTVSGQLNLDDYNVISNQLSFLQRLDVSGVTNGNEVNMKLSNKHVVTVVLPEGLTKISPSCFQNASNLTTVNIPSTVTEIGNQAFRGCSSLQSLTLPNALTVVGEQAFYSCKKLTAINLPSPLTVKRSAFFDTGFTTFTLPAGVKLAGSSIFEGCDSLRQFTFPDGLTTADEVGTSTFRNCYKLKEVRLPADLTEIPEAFFYSTALDTIIFPQAVTKVGYQAFYSMTSPKRIVLPDQITSIGSQAFYLNKAIEEVTWPAGCTTMNSDMFRYCSKLKSITLPETLDSLSGYNHFMGCSSLTSVHLPEGIRTLSGGMFIDCSNLKEVNIPAACNYISGTAFSNCRKMTHFDIPDAVTFIGNMAFNSCPIEDEELKLPSKLRVIGYEAFAGGKYQRVVVPEGCINIGNNAFYSSTLTTLDLPSTLLVVTGPLPGTTYNSALDTVIMRSLIPPYVRKNDMFTGSDKGRPTLCVPSAALSLYQLDSRFSGADTIVAISGYAPTTGVMNIVGKVTMTADCDFSGGKYDVNFFQQYLNRSKMNGNYDSDHPRLTIEEGATLHAGTIAMTCDRHDNHYGTYTWDAFINRGTCTADRIDLRWRMKDMDYYCPPFDTRMSDIIPEREGTPLIVYRYDTGARAVGDFDGTWVRLTSSDMLRAGQGYLIRTQPMISFWDSYYNRWEYDYLYMHHISHPGGTDFFNAAGDVALPMTHAAGEFEHNKNWNLVGQPYPAFFDIRGIDYDGPVLLATGSGNRWKAVSPLDDEVVLEPMQVFFVQVPDGMNSITLQGSRRQLGPKFENSTAANSRLNLRRADQQRQRVVYDATLLRQSEPGDEEPACTRFVINPEATSRYDIGRDAPAMSGDSCTLLYTWQSGGGVAYAINERPLADGIVRLGMQLAEAGTYTLALRVRGEAFPASEPVWLIDNEEHTRTLLNSSDETEGGYTFTVTEPATLSSRFVIAFGDAEPTVIDDCAPDVPQPMEGLFNLNGQRIGEPRKGLYISNGRIVMMK